MEAVCVLPGDYNGSDVSDRAGLLIGADLLSTQKRYIPSLGDVVIGVVVQKTAEFYKVDIRGPSPAILSVTAFNGATKRHKPNLNPGAIVVAFVSCADAFLDVELSCEDKTTPKDWSSNENLFGVLTGSPFCLITEVSLSYANSLQSANTSSIISALSKHFKFEMAVGKNGRIFISAETMREVLGISKAFTHAEKLTNIQSEALAKAIKNNLEQ